VQGVGFVLGTQTPFTLEDPEGQGAGVLLLHAGGLVAPLVHEVGVGSVTTKLAALLELQFPKQLLKLYKLSAPTLLTSPVCADTLTPNVPGFKDSGFLILKNKFLSVPPPNPRVPLLEEVDTALNPLPDQVTLLAPLPLNSARIFKAAFFSPPSNLNLTLYIAVDSPLFIVLDIGVISVTRFVLQSASMLHSFVSEPFKTSGSSLEKVASAQDPAEHLLKVTEGFPPPPPGPVGVVPAQEPSH
jgi:hypothetical protein